MSIDLTEEEKIGLIMLMMEGLPEDWSEKKKLERAMRYFGAATLTAHRFDMSILSVLAIQSAYVRRHRPKGTPIVEPQAKASFEEGVFWELMNEYDMFDPT